MATRKSSQSSATATAATTSANADAQDDAVATSAASTPSGTNGPDGTNSSNTPPSGGDAAGEASADSVKPQTNAETTTVEAANGTSTPETEASVSGTSSNASQGEADVAGENAGSDQPDFSMGIILDAVAASGAKDVVALMVLGRNVILAIDDVAKEEPDLARWLTDENPAGIIRDLSEQLKVLEDLLDARTSIKPSVEKRLFLITKNIRLDNVLHEIDDLIWLTVEEHANAFAVDACEPDWLNGGTRPE